MSTKLQYPPGTRSILMLEHDDDDRYITQATFDENHYKVRLHFVDNSNDLFAFLISCERNLMALPSLILVTEGFLLQLPLSLHLPFGGQLERKTDNATSVNIFSFICRQLRCHKHDRFTSWSD